MRMTKGTQLILATIAITYQLSPYYVLSAMPGACHEFVCWVGYHLHITTSCPFSY